MIDRRHFPVVALGVMAVFVAGCRDRSPAPPVTETVASPFEFTDVTESAGIRFTHQNGARGLRHLPETMGGGAAWLDVEGDGDLDLFVVQSGPLPDDSDAPRADNALYLNRGDGTFQDGTAAAGAAVSTGYGQGVAAGDADGDGRPDLYVTNYGPNVLLGNRGDGGFEDRTAAAGLSEDRWGSSAAFFDLENDGDLDLYVVNYLELALTDVLTMTDGGKGYLAYPHPDRYRSAADVLYRNDGAGRYVDVTEAAGILDVDGKGLGVAPVDLDADGDLDLYVANDSTPNFLFENLGEGRFADRTLTSNAGYNADGRTEAGMGIAVGDVDGDALPDVFVTNLDGETNTLYMNRGGLVFEDETRVRGLALDSMVFVGFGTAFLDLEQDGDLDLLVGNGHIIDNVEQLYGGSGALYRQRALLFENEGNGRFTELGARLPSALGARRVIRGLALADYDDDGDLDVALIQNAAPAVLLRNDASRKGHFLSLRVVDAAGNDVLHATAAAEVGGERITGLSLPGASYCASHDARILIGTPATRFDRVLVRWPTGERAVLEDVPTDRFLTVRPDGTFDVRAP